MEILKKLSSAISWLYKSSIRQILILTCICSLTLYPINAIPQPRLSSDLLANIVVALTKYLKWKEKDYKDNITICTLGSDGVGDAINRIASSQGQNITVKNQPDISALSKCMIVYISITEEGNADEILWRTKSKQILSVSAIQGFKEMGGIVQIVQDYNKVYFRFNVKSARNSQIIIDSDLLNMSTE